MGILKILFHCCILLIVSTSLFAHKFAKYNIVIDTDAGIDDFRAITYFMASRDYNINCITTVDGVLEPQLSANYISEVKKIYHHEGIPIGAGENTNASKKYEKHAMSCWKNFLPDVNNHNLTPAIDLLYNSITNEKKRTIIVAMGPLSNVSKLLEQHPEIAQKIEIILWYSDFDTAPKGYNYEQNPKAYEFIAENNIPIKIISGNNYKFSSDFLESCKELNSVYSNSIFNFFSEKEAQTLYLWDDFLPLYLNYPTMFSEKRITDYVIKVEPIPNNFYDILITSILNSEKPDEGVVFNEVPTSGFLLRKDVDEVAQELLAKHGYAEFKIALLTSEMHSHMGIYAILGAKMGLRIMEYLHAGLDEIEIVSYAGRVTPVSCFNDGLQVGTGATVGHGTIKIATIETASPSALVIYNNREILFKIKPELIAEIKKDVGAIIKAHGLESELYWSKLREIAIEKYWLKTSRFDIFDIEEIK
ncbi:nucleoside hydrolase [Bacteroidales bacterium OttesenSCG-928-I21]|nr:nucleoside hydrolase [Bacteroidales bacterium OttesenSCG-928-I21]